MFIFLFLSFFLFKKNDACINHGLGLPCAQSQSRAFPGCSNHSIMPVCKIMDCQVGPLHPSAMPSAKRGSAMQKSPIAKCDDPSRLHLELQLPIPTKFLRVQNPRKSIICLVVWTNIGKRCSKGTFKGRAPKTEVTSPRWLTAIWGLLYLI